MRFRHARGIVLTEIGLCHEGSCHERVRTDAPWQGMGAAATPDGGGGGGGACDTSAMMDAALEQALAKVQVPGGGGNQPQPSGKLRCDATFF